MPSPRPKPHRPKPGSQQTPSAFVSQYAEIIAREASGPIADVACGYGRHARLFANSGCQVYCLDNNAQALSTLNEASVGKGKLLPIEIDLVSDAWPFKAHSLGGIINVHYFQPELMTKFVDSLASGGYLLIETVGDRGGNYMELPKQGFVLEHIQHGFDVIFHQEKQVKAENSNAVTLKVLARKH